MKLIKPKKERFDINEDDDIRIDALDIIAHNINAYNIIAHNIDTFDINAHNINAENINALNIIAHNIDAYNINALDIDALDIIAHNIIQVCGTKLKVEEGIRAKVLIVYDDCKIEVGGKIDAKVVRLKR